MTLSYTGGMILYIATFALAFVSVAANLVLIVGLALLFVFPEPTGRAYQSSKRASEDGSDEQAATEKPDETQRRLLQR